MRIDPKHFNKFIAICAAITVVVIIFSTVRYSQKQANEYRENLSDINFSEVRFKSFSNLDSLYVNEHTQGPVVIQFWSTWSEKSIEVNRFINDYRKNQPNLTVIAAAVRDDSTLIRQYIDQHTYPFLYVEGTEFYQQLLVPGIPAQIFLNDDDRYTATNIGDNIHSIKEHLEKIVN